MTGMRYAHQPCLTQRHGVRHAQCSRAMLHREPPADWPRCRWASDRSTCMELERRASCSDSASSCSPVGTGEVPGRNPSDTKRHAAALMARISAAVRTWLSRASISCGVEMRSAAISSRLFGLAACGARGLEVWPDEPHRLQHRTGGFAGPQLPDRGERRVALGAQIPDLSP